MKTIHRPQKIGLLLAFLFLSFITAAGQDAGKIGKIEFEGLNRLSSEELIATSGLKVGGPLDVTALDSAAQRLADSGLFKKVAYSTRNNKGLVTITFKVEETSVPASRVIFDNFIWFTDRANSGCAAHIPSFSGTAPDNGDITDRIVRSLQTFLHENKIEATVSHMISQDAPGSPTQEHVFSVNGIPMPICTLHFPGAKNISEDKLLENSKPLVGSDYSNKFVSLFASNNLMPLYRERGQLRAAFSPPLAKPEATANCNAGVEVSLPVDEGLIYKFGATDWTGNTALTKTQLDELLGLKSGEVSDGIKLDKGVIAAQNALGRKGFILARIKEYPQFKDETRSVDFRFEIHEGPQFRMGRLSVQGFGDKIAKQISDNWRLKPGDIFDNGYAEDFAKKELEEYLKPIYVERRSQGRPAPSIKWTTKVNRESSTADVTVEMTN